MEEVQIEARIKEQAEFSTPLRIQLIDEWVNGRPTYRLLFPLTYDSLVADMRIVVYAGFDTDLASVPRLPVSCMFLGVANKAAVIHDALYQSKKVPRSVADDVFLEAMEVSRIPFAVRTSMYLGVRTFGEPSYNPEFKGWE